MTHDQRRRYKKLRHLKKHYKLNRSQRLEYRILRAKRRKVLERRRLWERGLRDSLRRVEVKMELVPAPPKDNKYTRRRLREEKRRKRLEGWEHVPISRVDPNKIREMTDKAINSTVKLLPGRDGGLKHVTVLAPVKVKERPSVGQSYGVDLLRLFNEQGVDFVRIKDGKIKPVDWPKQATHRLKPTLWKDDVPGDGRYHSVPVGYEGIAHAVALVPMKWTPPKSELKIKRPLSRWSKNWPPYKTEWELRKKRRALCTYAAFTGVHRKMKPAIMEMDHTQCNLLLKEFIKASRYLRWKMSRDPKVKAYWEKRKAELAAKEATKREQTRR